MHRSIAAALFVLICAQAAVEAEVVYEQAPLLGANMVEPFSGVNPAESTTPDGTGTTGFYDNSMADNFTLAATTTVTNLAWTGFIENFGTTTDSNISGFSIQFYSVTPGSYSFYAGNPASPIPTGIPEQLLFSEDFSLADCNPTVIENPNIYGTTTYSFDLNLGTPAAGQSLTFQAGQQYFVAINADIINPNDSSYFWAAGTRTTPDLNPQTIAVDGHTSSNGYEYAVEWNGQFGSVSGLNDLAFTLSDASQAPAAAPLPGSAGAGLLLLGLIAANEVRRRRGAQAD